MAYRNEKHRKYCLEYAEKKRRAAGVKKAKGTKAVCTICGKEYVRKSHRSVTCSDECRAEKQRRYSRARVNRLSRERGAPAIGEKMNCGHCGAEFIRSNPRSKYCQSCQELQSRGKLPHLEEYNREYRKAYHAKRMKEDPVYACATTVRLSVAGAISRMGYTKRAKCHEILGCDWPALKAHIESKFQEGMTWENRSSSWEVDHIIPVSSAKTEEEVLKLNHYTNLQPLWTEQNREKGSKLDWSAP